MSKVGKMPIRIPEGVTATAADQVVKVKGSLGELQVNVPSQIKVEIKDEKLLVSRDNDTKSAKSLHGLIRSLINNAIQGVSGGFSKTLEMRGVGYKAEVRDDKVILHVGFSHTKEVPIVEGVTIKQEKNTLTISGADKQRVGHMAALIRSIKKPEPYKGKGIKYSDEVIHRKAGKAAKTVT